MKQEKAKIISNTREAPGYHRISLACGPAYAKAQPGQFVTLRFLEGTGPLLRRPFSIHRLVYDDQTVNGIDILYKAVGAFTRDLSQACPGDRLDLLGPVGHGFTISPKYTKNVLVAGGIGVAPLVFLADRLAATIPPADCTVFIGGKSSPDVLCNPVFTALGMKIHITTEDGTKGEQGLVTHALTKWLKNQF